MTRLFLWTVFYFVCILNAMAQTKEKHEIIISLDNDTSILTVFIPEKPYGRAIIACPGGGYSRLAMNHEGTGWAEFFNQQGIIYGVLKYRMPHGDRNLPMNDAMEAIRIMRQHKKEWGVNPHDVGIMGSSAGGHLAATTATLAPKPVRPNFQILFYPVINMDKKLGHRGSSERFLGKEGATDTALIKQYSCMNNVKQGVTPPALLIWAVDDTVVPPNTNVVLYQKALEAEHIQCDTIVFAEGKHGFGIRKSRLPNHHNELLADIKKWLDSF